MKKILVFVAVAGVVVGVYYLLRKTEKEENISSKPMEEKNEFELKIKDETTVEGQDAVQEMYDAKEKSAQSVGERQTEAARIMADAFANIMKDVEPIQLDGESVETVVDTKDGEIINELDSLSDELDELAK